jgi:hypothetical protein
VLTKQAHKALGDATWETYCRTEFDMSRMPRRTDASYFAVGHYQITFPRSVSDRGWIATRNDVSEFRVDSGSRGLLAAPIRTRCM